MVKENNDSTDLFSALSNPLRVQILQKLERTPANSSHIAKSFDITIQAMQRHIDMLLDSEMILRDINGSLSLSAVGKASLEHMSTFDFLSKYKDYFQDHTFSGVPKNLIQRLGDLNYCEFIAEPIQGWQRAKDLVVGANEFLYMMTTMLTNEFYVTAKELIKKEVQFKILHSKEMIVAKGFSETRQENGWIDAISDGRVEEKYVIHLPVTIVLADNASLVLFANKKIDLIDGNSLFYSEHPDFRNWCLDLFNYYWNKVEKIPTPKLEEV